MPVALFLDATRGFAFSAEFPKKTGALNQAPAFIGIHQAVVRQGTVHAPYNT
jgi:hypothetical protein